jgi:hypothetical protein
LHLGDRVSGIVISTTPNETRGRRNPRRLAQNDTNANYKMTLTSGMPRYLYSCHIHRLGHTCAARPCVLLAGNRCPEFKTWIPACAGRTCHHRSFRFFISAFRCSRHLRHLLLGGCPAAWRISAWQWQPRFKCDNPRGRAAPGELIFCLRRVDLRL